MYYSIKLNENQKEKFLELFNKFIELTNHDNIYAYIRNGDILMTLYTNNTLLINGENISNFTMQLREALGFSSLDSIGSDEVGTGDVFGPIVVCSAYVEKKDEQEIILLNVRDSKSISDEKILEIGAKLIKKIPYSIRIIEPTEYLDNVKDGINLNKIKAIAHNNVIIDLLKKINKKAIVVVDQFCKSEQYFAYISNLTLQHRDIVFETKAESKYLSVAVASIIARYAYLIMMKKYSSILGENLLKGADYNVVSQFQRLLEKHGIATMSKYTKINFKNLNQLF